MKRARTIMTILLLLFVGATLGTLIAQEVARPRTQDAESSEVELPDETSISAAGETSTNEPVATLPETVVLDKLGLPEVHASDGISVAEETSESSALASPSTGTACVIEAIYFHNTYRCVTCLKIENEAKAIVEAEFSEELAAGTLRWSAIDVEVERAYISQYDLAMPSLVLIRKTGNEVVDWITLHDTWSNIRSSTRFSAYIIDSFQEFIEGCL